jgi:hypothetical protein
VRSAPQPVTAPVPGPAQDPVARGKYMASVGCGCHTAVDKMPWAGGENLAGPWGTVVSPNITPDPSGISYYTEATFITALRTGYVGARKLNSIMPFGDFKNLTDDDLKAIYAYLLTVPSIKHRVDNTLPTANCASRSTGPGIRTRGQSDWFAAGQISPYEYSLAPSSLGDCLGPAHL